MSSRTGKAPGTSMYLKMNPESMSINRSRFIEELKKRDVGTSVHFIPLYRHPYYSSTYGYESGAFPVSEHAYERIFSLPYLSCDG